MAYTGFSGPGRLGNFLTLAALNAAYPATQYAGREATVETAGLVALYFSNGATWVLIAS